MFLCQTVTNQYETDTETETKAVWLVFLCQTITNQYETETETDTETETETQMELRMCANASLDALWPALAGRLPRACRRATYDFATV